MPTIDASLAGLADPGSPVAEAYRALRTSVQFAAIDRPLRSLMVTSPGPEDDKPAVAANLAVAFAQGGSRVILVDCDLRHPRQHALFGLANADGLGAALLADEQAGLPLVDTGIAGLRLLPAGTVPPHAADLLGSPRMQRLLERLLSEADIVICDAPPILAVAEAAVLARRVDGVLCVVRAGRTKRDQAAKARALLAKLQVNVLGAVLTNAKLDRSLRSYYG